MNLILKISTLLFSQLSGFLAAIFAYEVFKIASGVSYSKPIWGLDIPFIYQTEKVYSLYCLNLSIWFLLLCIIGVITALKNKKIIPVIVCTLFLISIFTLLFLNGRYA